MPVSDIVVFVGVGTFFGLATLAALTHLLSDGNEDQWPPAPEGKMIFRRPLPARMAPALLGLALLGGPIMSLGGAMGQRPQSGAYGAVLLMSLMCLPFTALFLRLSGPEEVHFNVKEHTYRRVTGWPLFPTVLTGTWGHIFGVYVRRTSSSSSYQSFSAVGIYWVGSRGVTEVARFGSADSAESFARRLQLALDLRRVKPPRNW